METSLILGREIEGIALALCNCTNCSDAVTAIEVLKGVVRFLDPRPKNPDRTMAHPEEEARIEKCGSIMVSLDVTHPVLARDSTSLGLNWQLGVAGVTYYAKNNSIQISQTNSPSGETTEEIVQGLVNLAKIVAPVIGAKYGFVDAWTEKLMPRRVRAFRDIKYWCYANVLSSSIQKSAPEGFFNSLPASEQSSLSDGSLLIKSKQSFAKWYLRPQNRLAKYLAVHAPNIELFRQ